MKVSVSIELADEYEVTDERRDAVLAALADDAVVLEDAGGEADPLPSPPEESTDGQSDATDDDSLADVTLNPGTNVYRVASAVRAADQAVTGNEVKEMLEKTEWKQTTNISRDLKNLFDREILDRSERPGPGQTKYEYRVTDAGEEVIRRAEAEAGRTYDQVANKGIGALFNNEGEA